MRVLFNICFVLVSLVLCVYGEDISGHMQLSSNSLDIHFPIQGAQFNGILVAPVKQTYTGMVQASLDDIAVLTQFGYPIKFESKLESNGATTITFTDLRAVVVMSVTVDFASANGDSIRGSGEFAPYRF
ncbi:hypothetical protein DM01DRAFT_1333627 [Hesseltinella vesiculosa]|uniref:Uncharacterized protein n=1 Tax=Hesseltinella vesiculosa TaxID=101127 RepID=A0A1X2GQL1_9FUNG|nr:hypothetical protein DM01DRAFT_1333627 [Hesseltinella vesiculosa]